MARSPRLRHEYRAHECMYEGIAGVVFLACLSSVPAQSGGRALPGVLAGEVHQDPGTLERPSCQLRL